MEKPFCSASRAQAESLYYRALDLVACGEAGAAAGGFQAAIDRDPSFLDARHGLIRALQDVGEYERAISAARELIARDPDDPLAHTSLSILYQRRGMVPEAEAEALKAKLLGWKLELRAASAAVSTE
jgi:tetratricopeptide (TPR) repeat protein